MEIPAQPVADPTTWQDWVLAVLSGTVGSVLALLGLVGIYLLTQRNERRRASEIRRSESVGLMFIASEEIAVVESQESDATFERRAVACERYGRALLRFAAREVQEHGDVARWAIQWAVAFTGYGAVLRDGTRQEKKNSESRAITSSAQISASLLRWLENPGYAKFQTNTGSETAGRGAG